ncbi:MAG: hypothetical protein M1826_004900 [Phylliscum demangeonii]|nr:MAG: hypothetical protein M1826_004900 [Phylliscum demangeonii]
MGALDTVSHWAGFPPLPKNAHDVYDEQRFAQACASAANAIELNHRIVAVDSAPSVYRCSPELAYTHQAPSIPRTYPDIDLASLSAGVESPAYPPSAYLVDPQKHELSPSPSGYHQPVSCSYVDYDHRLVATPEDDMDDECQEPQALLCSSLSPPSQPCHSPDHSFRSEVASSKREPSPESDGARDQAGSDEKEPYAKLIYRALLEAPDHRLPLKRIYEWFIQNTDKSKNPSQKGWQNSIRHNLSMNGAFRKVQQDSFHDGKRGFEWVLEPSAIAEGVQSTTRYRKTGSGKPAANRDKSAAAPRPLPYRKDGRAGRRVRSTKLKRRERTPAHVTAGSDAPDIGSGSGVPGTGYDDFGYEGSSGAHLSMLASPPTSDPAPDEHSLLPYYSHPETCLARASTLDPYASMFDGIMGVVDGFPGESLFTDDSGARDDALLLPTDLQLEEAAVALARG